MTSFRMNNNKNTSKPKKPASPNKGKVQTDQKNPTGWINRRGMRRSEDLDRLKMEQKYNLKMKDKNIKMKNQDIKLAETKGRYGTFGKSMAKEAGDTLRTAIIANPGAATASSLGDWTKLVNNEGEQDGKTKNLSTTDTDATSGSGSGNPFVI